METNINRLVIFQANNGFRTQKNYKEASKMVADGLGFIEGEDLVIKDFTIDTPKEAPKVKKSVVKQKNKKVKK
jgi:hypothetical protein